MIYKSESWEREKMRKGQWRKCFIFFPKIVGTVDGYEIKAFLCRGWKKGFYDRDCWEYEYRIKQPEKGK